MVAVSFGSALAAQSGLTIPNRLLIAQKGEWVLYMTQENHGQKQTVTNIENDVDGDKVITVMNELLIDDNVVQQKEDSFHLSSVVREQENMLSADGPDLELSQGLEQLMGKDIEVVVIQYAGPDGAVVRSFLSDQVPVTGLLKIEIDGDIFMEVSDFGY